MKYTYRNNISKSEDTKVPKGCFVTTILGIIAVIVLFTLAYQDEGEEASGVVMEKHYVGPQDATGLGIDTNGDLQYQDIHGDEKYILLVKLDDGTVESVLTTPEGYLSIEKGDRIKCYKHIILRGEKGYVYRTFKN